jgi:hypothetical protein
MEQGLFPGKEDSPFMGEMQDPAGLLKVSRAVRAPSEGSPRLTFQRSLKGKRNLPRKKIGTFVAERADFLINERYFWRLLYGD